MADFYSGLTWRWSGPRVRVALVVYRRQESVPGQTAKAGDLDYADLRVLFVPQRARNVRRRMSGRGALR